MWELQRHMHSYIAPSIMKYAQEQKDPLGWLCQRVVDLSFDPENAVMEPDYDREVDRLREQYPKGKPIYWNPLVEALVEAAIAYGCTTNGGHEVYLGPWTSIPWCDEETMQEWYS